MTQTIAELTGRGSFTFKIDTERFRGVAVPLADYFSYAALSGDAGSQEYLHWLTPLLAERHLPGRTPAVIDVQWAEHHVRLHHREALEAALLEEVNPGDALSDDGEQFALGKVKVQALSYTLHEYAAWLQLSGPYADAVPMDLRLDEVARALRVRFRAGLSDSSLLTAEWLVAHVQLPEFRAIEHLLITGKLAPPAPAEPGPAPKS